MATARSRRCDPALLHATGSGEGLLAVLLVSVVAMAGCGYSIRSGPNLTRGVVFPRPATTVDVVNNTSCNVRVKLVGEEDVRALSPGGTASFRFYGGGDEFVIVASGGSSALPPRLAVLLW